MHVEHQNPVPSWVCRCTYFIFYNASEQHELARQALCINIEGVWQKRTLATVLAVAVAVAAVAAAAPHSPAATAPAAAAAAASAVYDVAFPTATRQLDPVQAVLANSAMIRPLINWPERRLGEECSG